MSDIPAVVNGDKPEPKRRGAYQVSARLQRALTLLASGEAKTQEAAATAAGLTRRALQLALKRPSVRTYMRDEIMMVLGVSAMRAAKRMDELLTSSNEMVSFQASRFALATGAGVAPPDRSAPLVSLNMQGSGYVIDLRPRAERSEPVSPADAAHLTEAGGVLRGTRRAAPVIEGETVEIDERASAND
jgi:hypothetical protein